MGWEAKTMSYLFLGPKHVSDEIECPVMAGREPNRKLAFSGPM
jgi:hypothetical protein